MPGGGIFLEYGHTILNLSNLLRVSNSLTRKKGKLNIPLGRLPKSRRLNGNVIFHLNLLSLVRFNPVGELVSI